MEPAAKYATVLSSDTKWESKLLASVPIDTVAEKHKPLLSQGWRPFAIAVDSNAIGTSSVPSPPAGAEGGRRPDEGAAPGRTVIPTVPEQLGQSFTAAKKAVFPREFAKLGAQNTLEIPAICIISCNQMSMLELISL